MLDSKIWSNHWLQPLGFLFILCRSGAQVQHTFKLNFALIRRDPSISSPPEVPQVSILAWNHLPVRSYNYHLTYGWTWNSINCSAIILGNLEWSKRLTNVAWLVALQGPTGLVVRARDQSTGALNTFTYTVFLHAAKAWWEIKANKQRKDDVYARRKLGVWHHVVCWDCARKCEIKS